MNEPIPIFTVADWRYRGPLAVMLNSLDRNGGVARGQPVFVLTPPQDAEEYRFHWKPSLQNLEVEFVPIDMTALGLLPISGHFGPMTYARLLLEDVLLCPHEKVLYMDSDILVRGRITELLASIGTMTTAIAGARECDPPRVSDRGGVFNWKELGLDPQQPYINAGVLGLRMDLVRARRHFSRALEYLARHGRQVINCDQGAINAVIGQDLVLWCERYNFTTSYLGQRSRRILEKILQHRCSLPGEATIVHFTGSGTAKPWHVNSMSPYTEEYRLLAASIDVEGFPRHETRLEKWLGVEMARYIRRCHIQLMRVG